MGYIYLIHDQLTNKIYIGQSQRCSAIYLERYLGSGIIIKSIIQKRKHLLKKIILGFCETKEELDEAEKECIEFFQSNDYRYGYNISHGGTGYLIPKATKEKISNSQKGKIPWNKGIKHSQKTKRKISLAIKGKIVSNETKEKMSKGQIGRKAWNKGLTLSEEHKQKMKVSQQRRRHGI